MELRANCLPRKTTLAKTDLSKLLAGKFADWMIFLLVDQGRLHFHGFFHCDGIVNWSCGFVHGDGILNWSCVKHSRLLNKTCREIWDDTFQVRLCVPYGYAVAAIRDTIECGSMMFYRLQEKNIPNKILCHNYGQDCLLTIPWQSFIKLDPITHSFFPRCSAAHAFFSLPRTSCEASLI